MVRDGEGFFYPRIDRRRCTDCGLCGQVCPMTPTRPKSGGEELYFGARANTLRDRLAGSSGGIFPLLARQMLTEGGIVYGALMESGGHIRHRAAKKEAALPPLQKTKYVQSEIGLCFREIRAYLEAGCRVLFAGTPCQCQGLRLFLRHDYPKLLTVDLICNGVTPPRMWEQYAAFLERRHQGRLEAFCFRDKQNRDNGHMSSYVIDGRKYARPSYEDPYCGLYFRNLITRPSCHSCPFCTPERDSDLTIGDFWGIEHVRPGFDDGLGSSLVILHTPGGKRAWEGIRERLEYFSCTRGEALQPEQPRLRTPAAASPRRALGMGLYRLLPFPVWLHITNMTNLPNLLKRRR